MHLEPFGLLIVQINLSGLDVSLRHTNAPEFAQLPSHVPQPWLLMQERAFQKRTLTAFSHFHMARCRTQDSADCNVRCAITLTILSNLCHDIMPCNARCAITLTVHSKACHDNLLYLRVRMSRIEDVDEDAALTLTGPGPKQLDMLLESWGGLQLG